jgi:hypothetical protein
VKGLRRYYSNNRDDQNKNVCTENNGVKNNSSVLASSIFVKANKTITIKIHV